VSNAAAAIPETVRTTLGQARGDLERRVVSCALSALLVPVSLAFVFWRTPAPLGVAFAVAAAVLCRLSYQGAVQAAVTFGEIVRTAFDLHRRELLLKFDLEPPATLAEERALWKALGQQLYRRGADEPERIRFKPRGEARPPDAPAPPPAGDA
jgi:hypothetical protein